MIVFVRFLLLFLIAAVQASVGSMELVGMMLLVELVLGGGINWLVWLAVAGGVWVDILQVRPVGWTGLILLLLLGVSWFYGTKISLRQKRMGVVMAVIWSSSLRLVHGSWSVAGVIVDVGVFWGLWLAVGFWQGKLKRERGIYLS